MIHDGFLVGNGNSFSGFVRAVHDVLFFRGDDINPSDIIFHGGICWQRGRIHPVSFPVIQTSQSYPSHMANNFSNRNLHPHLAGHYGELAVVVLSEMIRID